MGTLLLISLAAVTAPPQQDHVEQLARRFRIAAYEQFREQKDEYIRCRDLSDEFVRAWDATDRAADVDATLRNWFLTAREAVVAGEPLPAAPDLASQLVSRDAPTSETPSLEAENANRAAREIEVPSPPTADPADNVMPFEVPALGDEPPAFSPVEPVEPVEPVDAGNYPELGADATPTQGAFVRGSAAAAQAGWLLLRRLLP